MIAGELLDSVEANYDEITFKRGNDYDYSIEVKMVPEFKEVLTRQVLYHNPVPLFITPVPFKKYDII
jgi:hypothetical protein